MIDKTVVYRSSPARSGLSNDMWLKLAPLLLFLAIAPVAHAQGDAYQNECKTVGKRDDGGYQFLPTCMGRLPSPDGKFAVVQKVYEEAQPPVEFQDAHGRTLVKLLSLTDEMPLVVTWSPNSKWFLVNHYVGSGMDTLQVFEVVGQTAVERPAIVKSAVRLASRRYSCLRPDMILPNGVRWSQDSRRIVLVTISRADACRDFGRHRGTWHSLWMIGDVDGGRIDPASIRVQSDDKPLTMPKTGAYSGF